MGRMREDMVSGSLQGDGFAGEADLQVLRVAAELMADPISSYTAAVQHGGLDRADDGLGIDDELIAATKDDVLTHGVCSLETRVIAGDGPVCADVAVVVGEVTG